MASRLCPIFSSFITRIFDANASDKAMKASNHRSHLFGVFGKKLLGSTPTRTCKENHDAQQTASAQRNNTQAEILSAWPSLNTGKPALTWSRQQNRQNAQSW